MKKLSTTGVDRDPNCGCSTVSGLPGAENTALQLKALAHPVRLQIMELLRCKEHKCCGDICACLPLAQSTISQHLELLCRAGLVSCQPDGTRSNYSLNAATVADLAGRIAGLSPESHALAPDKIPEST